MVQKLAGRALMSVEEVEKWVGPELKLAESGAQRSVERVGRRWIEWVLKSVQQEKSVYLRKQARRDWAPSSAELSCRLNNELESALM